MANAVQDNWNAFNQNKQVLSQNDPMYSVYNNLLNSGQSIMSTNSGTGQAYYAQKDASGNIYQAPVPNAFYGPNPSEQKSQPTPQPVNPSSPQNTMNFGGASSGTTSLGQSPVSSIGQQQSAYQNQINQMMNSFNQAQAQQQQQWNDYLTQMKQQTNYNQSQVMRNQYGDGIHLFFYSNNSHNPNGASYSAPSNTSITNSGSSNTKYVDAISRMLSSSLWSGYKGS